MSTSDTFRLGRPYVNMYLYRKTTGTDGDKSSGVTPYCINDLDYSVRYCSSVTTVSFRPGPYHRYHLYGLQWAPRHSNTFPGRSERRFAGDGILSRSHDSCENRCVSESTIHRSNKQCPGVRETASSDFHREHRKGNEWKHVLGILKL